MIYLSFNRFSLRTFFELIVFAYEQNKCKIRLVTLYKSAPVGNDS